MRERTETPMRVVSFTGAVLQHHLRCIIRTHHNAATSVRDSV